MKTERLTKLGPAIREGMAAQAAQVDSALARAANALLERAAEETSRMGRAERILYWDRRQSIKVSTPDGDRPGPDVILCGHDRNHGPLMMHGSGSLLICLASKQGAACTFNQPVSL